MFHFQSLFYFKPSDSWILCVVCWHFVNVAIKIFLEPWVSLVLAATNCTCRRKSCNNKKMAIYNNSRNIHFWMKPLIRNLIDWLLIVQGQMYIEKVFRNIASVDGHKLRAAKLRSIYAQRFRSLSYWDQGLRFFAVSSISEGPPHLVTFYNIISNPDPHGNLKYEGYGTWLES